MLVVVAVAVDPMEAVAGMAAGVGVVVTGVVGEVS